MTDAVRIGLVLPDVMGTYGDGGNAVVLRQRLLLRGIAALFGLDLKQGRETEAPPTPPQT